VNTEIVMDESMSVDRQQLDVDIACVGFGPATGGFLTTLSRAMAAAPDDPAFQSRVTPGMPLQVICYERADDLGFGVSGVVTRARNPIPRYRCPTYRSFCARMGVCFSPSASSTSGWPPRS
jgi:hypothetical protein